MMSQFIEWNIVVQLKFLSKLIFKNVSHVIEPDSWKYSKPMWKTCPTAETEPAKTYKTA